MEGKASRSSSLKESLYEWWTMPLFGSKPLAPAHSFDAALKNAEYVPAHLEAVVTSHKHEAEEADPKSVFEGLASSRSSDTQGTAPDTPRAGAGPAAPAPSPFRKMLLARLTSDGIAAATGPADPAIPDQTPAATAPAALPAVAEPAPLNTVTDEVTIGEEIVETKAGSNSPKTSHRRLVLAAVVVALAAAVGVQRRQASKKAGTKVGRRQA